MDLILKSNNFTYLNETLTNYSMEVDKNLDDICGDSGEENKTLCNKGSLGISLSTPILMMSFGVLGNIIALVVLYTAKKDVQKTVFYTLLAGLAWTDLTGQLLVAPIAIVVYANNMKWVGGEPLCKYHAFMMISFGCITPILVCAMSVERFLALRYTYFYTRNITRRKAQVAIVVCWIFVILFCSLPLIGLGSYEHQFPGSWCFLNFHKESTVDIIYAYMYSILNVLIITTIILCNTTVIFTLIQMKKSRKLNNSPSLERRHGIKTKSKLKIETETQMVWFLCAITLVFSTCYLPLNIHIIINQITGRINYAADLISIRLASINQILDPWLYILLRKAMIVKIFKLLKNYIVKGKRYESPAIKRSNNNCVSLTIDRSNAHELKQFGPEVKVVVGPDDACAGSDSELSTSSRDNLVFECDASINQSHSTRPPALRSISSDPKFEMCSEQNSKPQGNNEHSDDAFEESSCFASKGNVIRNAFRRGSNAKGKTPGRRKRTKSLPATLESSKRHNLDSTLTTEMAADTSAPC